MIEWDQKLRLRFASRSTFASTYCYYLFYPAIHFYNSGPWSTYWTSLDTNKTTNISWMWWWSKKLPDFTNLAIVQKISKTWANWIDLLVRNNQHFFLFCWLFGNCNWTIFFVLFWCVTLSGMGYCSLTFCLFWNSLVN